eukprot:1952940-Rhodomonas_salina.3
MAGSSVTSGSQGPQKAGIGIVIQPNASEEMMVVKLVPNGPADLCGEVHEQDILESVDGLVVRGANPSAASPAHHVAHHE